MDVVVELCREHAQFERFDYEATGKAARLGTALSCDPPRLYAWVGGIGDELVGYATAAREYSTLRAGEYLHMDCLFVRESARGAGIGAALLHAVVASARALGLSEIQWQTPEWNADASRFYQRHGGIARHKLRFTLDTGTAVNRSPAATCWQAACRR
jgi:GNAT superfamily N-acetyltransferase